MFGLIRSSTHRKIYVRQGEAYRREIEEARAEARRAKAELEQFTRGMVHHVSTNKPPIYGYGFRLMVEVSPHLCRDDSPQQLYRYVTEEIMRQLTGLRGRDPRPDLREEKPRFAFPEPRSVLL